MHQQSNISDNVLIALRKIIQAIELNSKRLVKQVGLTGPQLVILHYIASAEEISVGDVAKNVSLSQGTVTGISERMEKRKLVARQKNSQDKRRVMVRITESGKQLLATAPPVMQESFLKKFNKTEIWEQTMLLSALQRLVSMMDAKDISAASFLSAVPIRVSDNQKEEADVSEKI
jgi:DNA-binding MarR family transcriptional regulator